MINIALTTEFTIPAGGLPWPGQVGSSGGPPQVRWSAWRRSLPSRPMSTLIRWCGRTAMLAGRLARLGARQDAGPCPGAVAARRRVAVAAVRASAYDLV